MKREVAAEDLLGINCSGRSIAGFPWSECQVRKLATSHCITYGLCEVLTTHTAKCTVTACRTGVNSTKRRRLFYGKSSNENHFESV